MPWVENFQHLFKESASTQQVLLTENLSLQGDIVLSSPGSIAAKIKGSLESHHHLTIEEEAHFSGSCKAANLHVSGRVDGNLSSRDHLRLSPTSYVRADLTAATLEITPKADFEGALNIGFNKST